MSRDLLASITVVIDRTERLLDMESDDVKRGHLDVVLTSARRLRHQIDDLLLDCARIRHQEVTASSPHPAPSPVLSRVFKILLVDDMEENIILAKLRLERLGHHIQVAHDGCEALEAWTQGGMDLILMDIQMPCMDGYQATRAIREREAGFLDDRHIPVIAMTAATLQRDLDACLEAGMDAFITKPIDFSRLSLLMEQVAPSWIGRVVPLPLASVTSMTEDLVACDELDLPLEWQGLSGIDVALGLAKWGNALVYRKTLIGFARKHADDGTILRNALSSQDIHKARSVAHAMKGAAGTLAACDLEAAAMALNGALRQRKEEEGNLAALLVALEKRHIKLADLVDHFVHALDVVIASCQRLSETGKTVQLDEEDRAVDHLEKGGGQVAPKRVDAAGIALMRTMARNLSHGDISGVEEGVAALMQAHWLRRVDMEVLAEQVDELDLDQALVTLNKIASFCGVDLDRT